MAEDDDERENKPIPVVGQKLAVKNIGFDVTVIKVAETSRLDGKGERV